MFPEHAPDEPVALTAEAQRAKAAEAASQSESTTLEEGPFFMMGRFVQVQEDLSAMPSDQPAGEVTALALLSEYRSHFRNREAAVAYLQALGACSEALMLMLNAFTTPRLLPTFIATTQNAMAQIAPQVAQQLAAMDTSQILVPGARRSGDGKIVLPEGKV